MVFDNHRNFSFYCVRSRRLGVACGRTEQKTHGVLVPNDLKIVDLLYWQSVLGFSHLFELWSLIFFFMFCKRKKLINFFPEEKQAWACSHLNFAEGEFLITVVLRSWKRMGMGLPAPDICWSLVVCLSWGPLGDLGGENLWMGSLSLPIGPTGAQEISSAWCRYCLG